MLKVLKWVIGVPMGLFVLTFVLFSIFSKPNNDSLLQREAKDCRRNMETMHRTDPMGAAMKYSECQRLQEYADRFGKTK